MAFVFRKRYEPQAEEQTRAFFKTLSERDQRRFAALEAQRLGRGGIEYVAQVLGCSTRTIGRGLAELERLPNDPAAGRVRRPGGGRKKKGGIRTGT
jgi:2-oxo-4-hydroxy-4-carboxy--5-ureidoimidazoline (OHCU) decarboxylase